MDDWKQKKEKIGRYYGALIAQHGHAPQACDYGRSESQEKKFRVLADVMDLQGKSVLDVGCGFADFAGFLQNKFDGVQYNGVDITAEFVAQAQALYPNCDIRQLDILSEDPGRSYDLVTANGIFYLMGDQAEDYMCRLIERMFELCLDAVAFNSLSAWCEDQESGEFYADPVRTVAFCKTLTPWVTLRHDYHSRDFTIYMRREQIS